MSRPNRRRSAPSSALPRKPARAVGQVIWIGGRHSGARNHIAGVACAARVHEGDHGAARASWLGGLLCTLGLTLKTAARSGRTRVTGSGRLLDGLAAK
jgi:hypothetical protein